MNPSIFISVVAKHKHASIHPATMYTYKKRKNEREKPDGLTLGKFEQQDSSFMYQDIKQQQLALSQHPLLSLSLYCRMQQGDVRDKERKSKLGFLHKKIRRKEITRRSRKERKGNGCSGLQSLVAARPRSLPAPVLLPLRPPLCWEWESGDCGKLSFLFSFSPWRVELRKLTINSWPT